MNSEDLSNHHEPVSDLLGWPQSPEEWEPYRLSEEQVAFFNANGYLAGIPMLSEEQVDRLNAELAELTDPSHPGNPLFYEFHSNEAATRDKVLFHALGAWRISPGFHDLLWNPAFLMAAYQLLGESAVRFWHDQLFCKPARHGGVVAWHQDYSYWTRTRPMAHLTCWTGLDDATEENGCLQYIPGSHKWGLLEAPEIAGDMEAIQNSLTDDQKEKFQPVAIELNRGEAAFHHPLIIHGSYENSSNRSRRAFVLNVFQDGVRSDSNESLLDGVPVIPSGKKMEGRFFPLLFDGPMQKA